MEKNINVIIRFSLEDLQKKGQDIPRREIYIVLRDQWLQETGKTSAELAKLLEISAQSCSTLASGTNARLPAWYLIMRLCKLLNYQIYITLDSIEIVREKNI